MKSRGAGEHGSGPCRTPHPCFGAARPARGGQGWASEGRGAGSQCCAGAGCHGPPRPGDPRQPSAPSPGRGQAHRLLPDPNQGPHSPGPRPGSVLCEHTRGDLGKCPRCPWSWHPTGLGNGCVKHREGDGAHWVLKQAHGECSWLRADPPPASPPTHVLGSPRASFWKCPPAHLPACLLRSLQGQVRARP